MDRDAAKKAAGQHAATLVRDGMRLGLGTGSTTAYAIKAIGRRISEENLEVQGVPTSFGSERLARTHGIPLTTLDETPSLDLVVDGADEVDSAFRLIKGGGGAHSREKVVAAQTDRFVVVVDPTKEVDQLGTQAPVPIEVLPMAVTPVARALETVGITAELRTGTEKDGPVVTDQGLWLLDGHVPEGIDDPAALNQMLCTQPGILDHGLFLDMVTDVIIGSPDGSTRHRTG